MKKLRVVLYRLECPEDEHISEVVAMNIARAIEDVNRRYGTHAEMMIVDQFTKGGEIEAKKRG